ncbi:hypothetical protein QQF64_027295 [Cirrhinus molitorella]|uniref:Uncharacterized protein n=1 Tax=Cirrhinus molitorella TaxID=172907 RepID=A0ABR3NBZ6_9TELE
MRTESFEKLLSLKSIKWSSSSNQASIHERDAEGTSVREHEMSVKKRRRTDSSEKLLCSAQIHQVEQQLRPGIDTS